MIVEGHRISKRWVALIAAAYIISAPAASDELVAVRAALEEFKAQLKQLVEEAAPVPRAGLSAANEISAGQTRPVWFPNEGPPPPPPPPKVPYANIAMGPVRPVPLKSPPKRAALANGETTSTGFEKTQQALEAVETETRGIGNQGHRSDQYIKAYGFRLDTTGMRRAFDAYAKAEDQAAVDDAWAQLLAAGAAFESQLESAEREATQSGGNRD